MITKAYLKTEKNNLRKIMKFNISVLDVRNDKICNYYLINQVIQGLCTQQLYCGQIAPNYHPLLNFLGHFLSLLRPY